MLSQRVQILKASPTLQLAAKAKELSAQGKNVISMSVGEPDWSTYEYIKQAAHQSIDQGFTKYTENSGLLELRNLISKQVEDDIQIKYAASEVLVSSGAKFSLYLAIQCMIDPGDEVIIPAPYWVSYSQMVELAGGIPVIVTCEEKDQFKISAEKIKNAITSKTKMFLLCSPNNPTGIMYSEDELKKLSQVLLQNSHVYTLSDDIYNRLVFSDIKVAPHLLKIEPKLKDQFIIVNGVSKTFAMTGWRIGWAIGPQKLIKAMSDLQSQSTSCACSISQKAAIAALNGGYSEVNQSIEVLKNRLKVAQTELNKISELSYEIPHGAFYLWLNIKKIMGKKYKSETIKDGRDFSKYLLEDFFVAVVPGLEFGLEGYLRLSIALSESDIKEAILRIKTFVDQTK